MLTKRKRNEAQPSTSPSTPSGLFELEDTAGLYTPQDLGMFADRALLQGETDVRPATNLLEAVARGQAVLQGPRAAVRWPLAVGRTYERFLELPVVVVLAMMWVAGAALLGSIALALYWTGWVLVQLAAGAI